jgi:hypothetical protein
VAVSIVDGSVVDLAIALRPATIITSDPDGMLALLRSANIPCDLVQSRNRAADVLVFSL